MVGPGWREHEFEKAGARVGSAPTARPGVVESSEVVDPVDEADWADGAERGDGAGEVDEAERGDGAGEVDGTETDPGQTMGGLRLEAIGSVLPGLVQRSRATGRAFTLILARPGGGAVPGEPPPMPSSEDVVALASACAGQSRYSWGTSHIALVIEGKSHRRADSVMQRVAADGAPTFTWVAVRCPDDGRSAIGLLDLAANQLDGTDVELADRGIARTVADPPWWWGRGFLSAAIGSAAAVALAVLLMTSAAPSNVASRARLADSGSVAAQGGAGDGNQPSSSGRPSGTPGAGEGGSSSSGRSGSSSGSGGSASNGGSSGSSADSGGGSGTNAGANGGSSGGSGSGAVAGGETTTTSADGSGATTTTAPAGGSGGGATTSTTTTKPPSPTTTTTTKPCLLHLVCLP